MSIFDQPPRAWMWRGIRFLTALVLLASIVEFTTAFSGPFVASIKTGRFLEYLNADARGGVVEPNIEDRSAITKQLLKINAQPFTVRADYEFWIPKNHGLLKELIKNLEQGTATLLAVFGGVSANGEPMMFRDPQLAVEQDKPYARISVSASYNSLKRSATIAAGRPNPPVQAQDCEVVVKTTGAKDRTTVLPVSKSVSEAVYKFDKAIPENVSFRIEFEPAPDLWPVVRQDFTYRLGLTIWKVIPPLLLGWLVWRNRNHFGGSAESIAGMALLSAALEASGIVLGGAQTISGNLGGLADGIQRVLTQSEAWRKGPIYTMLAMTAFAWPLAINRLGNIALAGAIPQPMRGKARAAALLAGLGWIALTATAWYYIFVWSSGDVEEWQKAAAFAFTTFPLIFVAAYWTLSEMGQERQRAVFALAMTLLLVFLVAVIGYSPQSMIAGTSIAMFCGAPLVAAMAALAFRTLGSQSAPGGMGLWMIGAALAVPFLVVYPNDYFFYAPWRLSDHFVDLTMFLVLIAVVRWMKDAALDSGWPECLPVARTAGILLAVLFLFQGESWQAWLVKSLAGFLLIRYLLFQLPEVPSGFQARPEVRAGVLAGMMHRNELARVARVLKRELLGKLSKGEVTYLSYRSKLDPIEQEAADAELELNRDPSQSKDLVLTFGPTSSAWRNGVIMAQYGLLIASPWIVLGLRDPSQNQWYGLLPALNSALLSVSRWILYGFFLGYFYAYIRGRSGIQKALWFGLTMVAPFGVSTGLLNANDPKAWTGLASWSLQLLITLLLLGLVAGDVETLRRAGYRWRHLMEVHDLGALSAWASTLAIAIGSMAATLLASGIGVVFTAALKLAGVPLPDTTTSHRP